MNEKDYLKISMFIDGELSKEEEAEFLKEVELSHVLQKELEAIKYLTKDLKNINDVELPEDFRIGWENKLENNEFINANDKKEFLNINEDIEDINNLNNINKKENNVIKFDFRKARVLATIAATILIISGSVLVYNRTKKPELPNDVMDYSINANKESAVRSESDYIGDVENAGNESDVYINNYYIEIISNDVNENFKKVLGLEGNINYASLQNNQIAVINKDIKEDDYNTYLSKLNEIVEVTSEYEVPIEIYNAKLNSEQDIESYNRILEKIGSIPDNAITPNDLSVSEGVLSDLNIKIFNINNRIKVLEDFHEKSKVTITMFSEDQLDYNSFSRDFLSEETYFANPSTQDYYHLINDSPLDELERIKNLSGDININKDYYLGDDTLEIQVYIKDEDYSNIMNQILKGNEVSLLTKYYGIDNYNEYYSINNDINNDSNIKFYESCYKKIDEFIKDDPENYLLTQMKEGYSHMIDYYKNSENVDEYPIVYDNEFVNKEGYKTVNIIIATQ